ncbi:type II secretion system protein [Sulfurovum sp.]|uniref:type II secretion system protein n=1 Tax=Sulfurovum sp. TaxID=1969726 RepID=UPI003562DB04
MKRAGFTMVELLFVIVVIGVISAVAITKLSTTRNDAKISIELANMIICVKDLGAQYAARKAFDAWGSPACVATYDNGNGCLINQPQEDGTVNVIANTQNIEPWCTEVQTIAKAEGLIARFTFNKESVTR